MLDPISEEILVQLDSEAKQLQKIADELNVSIDKVKRVSRIRNIRLTAAHHLSMNERSNLQDLGFKALILAPFIKKEDGQLKEFPTMLEEKMRFFLISKS